jgi:hypothetical protein
MKARNIRVRIFVNSTNRPRDTLALLHAWLLQIVGHLSTRRLPSARYLLQGCSLGPNGRFALPGNSFTLAVSGMLEDMEL